MAIRRRKLIRQAVPVEELPGISREHVQALHAHWIDSAQELLGIAESDAGRQGLRAALHISEEELERLLEVARSAVPQTRSRRLLLAAKTAEETDYLTGSVKPPPMLIEAAHTLGRYVTVAFPAGLPPAVDYRDKLPPIRSQGDRGTCVAFASCAVREHLEIVAGAAGDEIDLSEQFVYWYCKERDGLPAACGTFTQLGLKCMEELGVPAEVFWPYNQDVIPGNEGQGPAPDEALERASMYRIQRIINLNPVRVQDIKTCLADGKIVAFSIPVFDSWYYSAAVKRYGKITMPLPGEEADGGHAMAMVGYLDDDEAPGGGYFIVRNSWNPWGYQSTWGESYGTIPYAYIAEHCYAAHSADRFTDSDVFIRDSTYDDGTVGSGGETYWNSPDIWVRNAPDGVASHQNPVLGRANYLYLRVHNRGQAVAYKVQAHIYTCTLSPCIWPPNWKRLRTVDVPSVQPGMVTIGPIEWKPKDTSLYCYLVRLESPDDPVQHDWSVKWDNNIAQKNLAIVDLAPGQKGSLRFVMHGIWGKLSHLTLEVDRVKLPGDAELELQTATRRLAEDSLGEGVTIDLGKQRSSVRVTEPTATLPDLEVRASEEGKVTVDITLGSDAEPGAQHEVVFTQRLGPLVIGRLSCIINVVEP